MTNKEEIINNCDRCINCGHYYSPDELVAIDYYEYKGKENIVYVCYYCSSDEGNET